MKPVNLLPGDAPAVVAVAGGGGAANKLGMIGGAAAGMLAVVCVAAYFAMARVDSVKSETLLAQTQATQATTDSAAVQSQIQSLGQPANDSDKDLAQGAEKVLVAAYSERHNYPNLLSELKKIMDGRDGWYEQLKVRTHPIEQDSRQIVIEGYMPDAESMASFNERANLQSTMENAEIVELREKGMFSPVTRSKGRYWWFKMTADLVDTVAPTVASELGSPDAGPSGTTVSEGSQNPKMSLEDRPAKAAAAAAKPAKPAKPANKFDVAATFAGRGGGS